jgi:hypothetical protein
MLLSCQQNARQNHDRYFENVAQFKCLGTTVRNQNFIQEKIERKLNWLMLATIQSRTFCLFVCCVKT